MVYNLRDLCSSAPAGAPANVSSYNVTLDSAVLQWSSIPEEEVRGFLLGYVIFHAMYRPEEGMEKSKNVTRMTPRIQTLGGIKVRPSEGWARVRGIRKERLNPAKRGKASEQIATTLR